MIPKANKAGLQAAPLAIAGSVLAALLLSNGDALVIEQSGTGKGDMSEPPSCDANGHADGTFFLTEKK